VTAEARVLDRARALSFLLCAAICSAPTHSTTRRERAQWKYSYWSTSTTLYGLY
jgi:hypothetical protein